MAEIDTRRRLGHAICPGKLIRCVRSACCVYLLLSWKVDVCIQRNAHVPFFAFCGAQIGCVARDRQSGHVLQTALADAKSAEHVEHVVFQKSVFLFFFLILFFSSVSSFGMCAQQRTGQRASIIVVHTERQSQSHRRRGGGAADG